MVGKTTDELNQMSIIEYFMYCEGELVNAVQSRNNIVVEDYNESLRILEGTINEDIEFRGC